METKVSNQIISYDLCLFKSTLSSSWMALFSLFLLFSTYLVGFGFLLSFIYTSLVVIFSTFLYVVSKHKRLNVDKLVEEKFLSSSDDEKEEIFSDHCESFASTDTNPLHKVETSQDLLSSESQEDYLSSSEGSEVDQSYDYSDGSISDEESLIEIALPSGHYVDMQKDESKYFNEQILMDLLSEFNEVIEEENLIEIDISMGSIKYSRFEIKA
jgi:hypothetical protein